ncbi:MAG: hypothetical protein KIS63_21650, partial [Caldilineales bacterium]|nr:hypothetical protein [Caldilineales bacterium]
MAAAGLSSCTEIEVTHLAQVSKAYSSGVLAHLGKDVVNVGHTDMIPLLIALSNRPVSQYTLLRRSCNSSYLKLSAATQWLAGTRVSWG